MIWFVVGGSLIAIYVLSIQPIVKSQEMLLSQHIQQIQNAQLQNDTEDITALISGFLSSPQGFITVAQDGEGNMYGALSHFPENLPLCPNMGSFPVWSGFETDIAVLEGCEFKAGNYRVLVANNNQFLTEIRQNFYNAALIIIIISFFISLIPSWIVRRKISAQIAGVHDVVSQIEVGQFSARIATSMNNDEWDKNANHINNLLDNMQSSVQQIQGVTDAIAHDLRTPLTRLKNKLNQLQKTEITHAQSQQFLDDIQDEFDDLLNTFNAMLELSKLEHSHVQGKFETVNLNQIVTDAVELIEPQLEEKAQSIVLIADDVIVKGERSLLFRVIYNLLDNSHKYCDSQTLIEVHLNHDKLIIKDNGPGIAPQQRDKVFQRLYRLDASRNTKGYGLGLAFVKTVLDLHNATIQLDYTDSKKKSGLKSTIHFNHVADYPSC